MRSLLPLLLLFASGCYTGPIEGGFGDDDDAVFDDDDAADDDDDAANDDDSAASDDDDSIPPDSDGDGVPDDADCAPNDASVYPGAAETCDGVDEDCDGDVDEGLASVWFDDADGDGWGDPASMIDTCQEPPAGWIGQGQDCDDTDPLVHPGSTLLVDGADSDCDGALDWELTIWISGDDDFEWCVDDETAMTPGGTNWQVGAVWTLWLESGDHVVGIRGWDTGMVITAAIAHIEMSNGTTWVSDQSWLYDPMPAAPAGSRVGWCQVGFDDSAWQNSNEIGPIGTSPWGNAPSTFPAGSPALWIWDHFPVNLNTQYLRKQITLP
ncbi:MAG: putative metal-binding motif-containing protein [Deltaproteobacteria bacterium]|nr:putative metal-binding motif-containing protein [Deltaproteobacteria bacterium]